MRPRDSTQGGRLRDPDAFYEALIDAHRGLDAEQSHQLNARLILLLAEQIGDDAKLHALLREACGEPPDSTRTAQP